MVIPGAQWLVAYEPDTGREIWRVNDGKGETGAESGGWPYPPSVWEDDAVRLAT